MQCWIGFELAFVYFLYVETRGPTLEEIAKIFDGHDAVANIDLEKVEAEATGYEKTGTTVTHRED
jgi:hypothetical protein